MKTVQLISQYASNCAACGGKIKAGKRIVWNPQTRQAVHGLGNGGPLGCTEWSGWAGERAYKEDTDDVMGHAH